MTHFEIEQLSRHNPAALGKYEKYWERYFLLRRRIKKEQFQERRRQAHALVDTLKQERGCASCGIDDPAVLHIVRQPLARSKFSNDPTSRPATVAEMAARGYASATIRKAIEGSEILCTACRAIERGEGKL